MSISIYYTSTRALTPGEADDVRAAATTANRGRSWLSSEPVSFFPELQQGKLVGGSKPNFTPQPDDKKSADASGLLDGGPREVVEILSQLSRDYKIDWQMMHDFGPLGCIRGALPIPACSTRSKRSLAWVMRSVTSMVRSWHDPPMQRSGRNQGMMYSRAGRAAGR